MQDSGFVRGGEAIRDANQQLEDLAPAAIRRAEPVAQRPAFDELGHEILPAVDLAGIMNGEDVRMIQRRCRPRFALETAPRGGSGHFIREDLQRDEPIQVGIERAVHDAHSTRADGGLDHVRPHADASQIGVRVILHRGPARQPAAILIPNARVFGVARDGRPV